MREKVKLLDLDNLPKVRFKIKKKTEMQYLGFNLRSVPSAMEGVTRMNYFLFYYLFFNFFDIFKIKRKQKVEEKGNGSHHRRAQNDTLLIMRTKRTSSSELETLAKSV